MTAAAERKITALRGDGVTLAEAADEFLSTHRVANPNTHRAYASVIDRTIAEIGGGARRLADVTDTEIGDALATLWGASKPATWNRNRAAVSSWLTWCQAKKKWAAPAVPADAERRREHVDHTKAVGKTKIQRLLSRRDIPLRERTLWRMLYETAARASEILDLNVEDLDPPNRSALVRRKGAAPLRRGASRRDDYDLRPVFWGAGTARLLSRHLQGRTAGPVFLTRRRPHAGRTLTERDVDPVTGLARLHYDTARHELDRYTATDGLGTGWSLHELRASSLTHSAEDGASGPLLQGLSGHRDVKSLARYVWPSSTVLRELADRRSPR